MRSIAQMEIQARCDRDEIRRLREENARLREYMRPDQIEEAETVTKLIRERDEARAEVVKHCDVLAERNRDLCEWQDTARNEMAGRAAAEAEVARLEGLILDWELYEPGSGCHANLLAEARRIRAQREEGVVSYVGEIEPT